MEKNLSHTLLLVDDNEDILEFLSDDLGDRYHILTALNGKKALNILDSESVDLVVSDIMMPEMDGFELCAAIKSGLEYSHVPVILLTAKNTLQSKIEGLELGADAYVEKPFSPEFLAVQILNLLKNRDKVKAYFSGAVPPQSRGLAPTRSDDLFLEKLRQVINANISNPDLDVDHLADSLHMSRPTFYRKVKAISDLSPNELINLARLRKAVELLNGGVLKIYEIAEMVGYSSQTQFGRNFQKQFGMSPTDYLKNPAG